MVGGNRRAWFQTPDPRCRAVRAPLPAAPRILERAADAPALNGFLSRARLRSPAAPAARHACLQLGPGLRASSRLSVFVRVHRTPRALATLQFWPSGARSLDAQPHGAGRAARALGAPRTLLDPNCQRGGGLWRRTLSCPPLHAPRRSHSTVVCLLHCQKSLAHEHGYKAPAPMRCTPFRTTLPPRSGGRQLCLRPVPHCYQRSWHRRPRTSPVRFWSISFALTPLAPRSPFWPLSLSKATRVPQPPPPPLRARVFLPSMHPLCAAPTVPMR
jgi:hypothetical protein